MVVLGILLFAVNMLVHAFFGFYAVFIAKLLVPVPAWRRACDRALLRMSYSWTMWNTRLLTHMAGFRMDAHVTPGIELARDKRYLIVSNHQTWSDIFALHAIFHPDTPFLTFFLKRQLFWVPLFGLIWWALGFPYMQRYTAAQLAKHPELKGRDLETTRRFCARIRGRPYAILNFVEGHRRTPERAKSSPFRHLLAPKAGGIAIALQALEYEFDHVLDVTLFYDTERNSFVDLLSGRVGTVHAYVRELPLDSIPRGDYFGDPVFADRFRSWLNGVWSEKDALLDELAAGATPATAVPAP